MKLPQGPPKALIYREIVAHWEKSTCPKPVLSLAGNRS